MLELEKEWNNLVEDLTDWKDNIDREHLEEADGDQYVSWYNAEGFDCRGHDRSGNHWTRGEEISTDAIWTVRNSSAKLL